MTWLRARAFVSNRQRIIILYRRRAQNFHAVPRRLKRNIVGVEEIDRPHRAVIDRIRNFKLGGLQFIPKLEQSCFRFDREGHMIEANRLSRHFSVKLPPAHRAGTGVFEKRHLTGPHLEKVVPITLMPYPRLQCHA